MSNLWNEVMESETRKDRITKVLSEALSPNDLEVLDVSLEHAGHAAVLESKSTETHFRLKVVSSYFRGKSMVESHRIVYGLLDSEFKKGLHAVEMDLQPSLNSSLSLMEPVLISFKLCPYVQRSVINLLHKNVKYSIKYIDLANKPDWFLKISPFGKVPVLQVGDDVLFESAVINEYLDEVYKPNLHPADPIQKAKHRAWTEYASALLVDSYFWTMAKEKEESDKKRNEQIQKFKTLEGMLPEGEVGNLFFDGGKLHLVDTSFAPYFMRLKFLKDKNRDLDILDGFPKLQKWSETLLGLDAVKNSVLPEVPEEYIQFIKSHNSYLGSLL